MFFSSNVEKDKLDWSKLLVWPYLHFYEHAQKSASLIKMLQINRHLKSKGKYAKPTSWELTRIKTNIIFVLMTDKKGYFSTYPNVLIHII